MKIIIKSTILGAILFQLPLLGLELPNRIGGKFGISSKNITVKKMSRSRKLGSCIPIMQTKMKSTSRDYAGIYVKSTVTAYTTITKCGQPYKAEVLWSELYLDYPTAYHTYHKKICGKGASNVSYFRAKCTYGGWFYERPHGHGGKFAASVDGYQLNKQMFK